MRNILIAALLLITPSVWSQGQTTIRLTDGKQRAGLLQVDRYGVARADGNTVVQMGFVLDSLRVPSNRYRAFTPVICSSDGQTKQRLKTLIVSGRAQNIVFEREGIDPLYADNCYNLRRQNGESQRYDYADVVARQPWHSDATLYLECDLCGCGDTLKSERVPLMLPRKTAAVAATYGYLDAVPAPSDKVYNLHGSAFITFVVDRWEMKPDYMDNRRELRKITDTLDIMADDKNITVERIKIHGWASPESPYEHNRMLATNRARSLTEYLQYTYRLPAEVFATPEATPENWEGLRQAVEELDASVLPHREQILALIDNPSLKPDPKEWKIKSTYPQEYRYLLRNVYPGLRRSDYDITFNIRKFTLDEAKEVYKTQPYRLSLRELWDVAHTFPAGSADYERAMQTALNFYPDSADAMINMANIALRHDDLLKAETLLEHAGESALADNARAILYLKQHRLDDAEAALQRAEQKGLNVALNRTALYLERREQQQQQQGQ